MNYRVPSPAPDQPPRDEDLFGWRALFHWLGFVLRAPLRHRVLAAAAFLLVFGLAVAALAVVPFRYQVQASLLAGYEQANALFPTERDSTAPTRAARDVLLRRENLHGILEKTGFVDQYLAKRPWAVRTKDELFEALRGRPRERQDLVEGLVDTLEDRLWVNVQSEGTLIVTLQWWDAELARQVVDAALESFVEARHEAEVEAIGEASKILEAKRALLAKDIELSVAALEKKWEELHATSAPVRPRPVRRSAPSGELVKLQGELAAKQNALAEMEGYRRQRISELQADLAQQETVYAADHPSIITTRRVLRSLSQPTPRVAELQGEIQELEREIARRTGQAVPRRPVGEAEVAVQIPVSEMADPRLEFERGQLENLLRQDSELLNRIQSIQVEQETADAAFRHRYTVISPGQLPRGPIKPYPLIFVVGGLLGGLSFAFFVAAAADLRSGRIIERWQVEEQLDLPVLAVIRK